jgi:hypothetical protein
LLLLCLLTADRLNCRFWAGWKRAWGEGVCAVENAVRKIKGRKTRVQGESTLGGQLLREEQVREEIESFLRALNSYPESFSRHPGISFEQHHSLIASEKAQVEKLASRRGAANSR